MDFRAFLDIICVLLPLPVNLAPILLLWADFKFQLRRRFGLSFGGNPNASDPVPEPDHYSEKIKDYRPSSTGTIAIPGPGPGPGPPTVSNPVTSPVNDVLAVIPVSDKLKAIGIQNGPDPTAIHSESQSTTDPNSMLVTSSESPPVSSRSYAIDSDSPVSAAKASLTSKTVTQSQTSSTALSQSVTRRKLSVKSSASMRSTTSTASRVSQLSVTLVKEAAQQSARSLTSFEPTTSLGMFPVVHDIEASRSRHLQRSGSSAVLEGSTRRGSLTSTAATSTTNSGGDRLSAGGMDSSGDSDAGSSLTGGASASLKSAGQFQCHPVNFKQPGLSELPPLCITSQAFQCSLWVYYGIGIQNTVAYGSNAIGAITGYIALLMYFACYKPEEYKGQLRLQVSVGLFLVLAYGVAGAFFLQESAEDSADTSLFIEFTGWTACFLGIGLAAHPLFTLLRVLKTKNLAKMGSLFQNIFTFFLALSWFVNGVLYMKSAQIGIMNGLGIFANTLALTVRWIYRDAEEKGQVMSDDEYRRGECLRDGSVLSGVILGVDKVGERVGRVGRALVGIGMRVVMGGGVAGRERESKGANTKGQADNAI